MNIRLSPKKVLKINLYLISFLLCANILGIIAKLSLKHDYVFVLTHIFDFNSEKSIPTLYSLMLLVFASILLFMIALNYRRLGSSYIPWLGLSLIFIYLSIDELCEVHEYLGEVTKQYFQGAGLFYYSWIIPYGIALLVFIIVYSRFFFKLPKETKVVFLISGVIFVSGAMGFEMLGGRQYELSQSTNTVLYSFFYSCEETFEMLGIALFIYGLIRHIVHEFDFLEITIKKEM